MYFRMQLLHVMTTRLMKQIEKRSTEKNIDAHGALYSILMRVECELEEKQLHCTYDSITVDTFFKELQKVIKPCVFNKIINCCIDRFIASHKAIKKLHLGKPRNDDDQIEFLTNEKVYGNFLNTCYADGTFDIFNALDLAPKKTDLVSAMFIIGYNDKHFARDETMSSNRNANISKMTMLKHETMNSAQFESRACQRLYQHCTNLDAMFTTCIDTAKSYDSECNKLQHKYIELHHSWFLILKKASKRRFEGFIHILTADDVYESELSSADDSDDDMPILY